MNLEINFQLVDRQAQLDQWTQKVPEVICFDTEFTRRKTYLPIPELLQVATEEETLLIDARSPLSFDRISEWFVSEEHTRVGHSVEQDIEVLNLMFGKEVGFIDDTQLANEFLGFEMPVGYGKLVEKLLQINLSKHLQASDWSRRPFALSQLQYAANDIKYLSQLWQKLRYELESRGRWNWYLEERNRRQRPDQADPINMSVSFNKMTRLSNMGINFLQRLLKLQHTQALRANIPINWVIATNTLVRVASAKRLNNKVLREQLSESEYRRLSRRIFRLYSESYEAERENTSVSLEEVHAGSQQLTELCETVAKKHEIAPTLMSLRDTTFALKSYLTDGQIPKWFGQWRTELFGDQIREIGSNWTGH